MEDPDRWSAAMLDITTASRRSSRPLLHRSSHQLKAEKYNKMESEALRRNVRLLDCSAQRFSDGVFREKKQVSHQLEATRQTSGHSSVSLRPDNARDLDGVLKTRWFHDNSSRISEKDLRRWRTTEQELARRRSAGVPRPEMSQRERNRRIALTELLRTTGLLTKNTKKVLLSHADFFPQVHELEESEGEEEELRSDTASSSLRAQFPRAFAFCSQTSSSSSFSLRSETPKSLERAVTRLVVTPVSASPSMLRARPISNVMRHFPSPDVKEDEENMEKSTSASQDGEIGEERSAFASLPKWKRDLMIEAPLFAAESPTEGVRLAISKSQLKRDLQELKAENLRRSKLIHASNMKKVFL